ncbi:DUF192 domain-containing protein [Defluviimonas sp. WL0024]|uniref:DUF192 domain-containing protein n=2 Tax=Albidovulum TaxID=205889 RepID=A0ABT3IXU6_9RHOB|nr:MULTISPECIES: DUF192 domain-containing protein [Defluviimonas]MCU9846683.1 DUF192 domain-containing protein [Defluviimonas sp. WL0024]MCW3780253.1 DUF192 domain-containing protein [Defluviimonas salinarum]
MTPRAVAAFQIAACLAGPATAGCGDEVAAFRWPGGAAEFAIEIADDAEERARGLMFREALAADAGMLFIYERPQAVAFWMRNTLIPLDMVFIGTDGRVNGVHAMAVPGDETPIPGPPETLMVLEIAGGRAAELGLVPGAELRHPRLVQATALWPCGQP